LVIKTKAGSSQLCFSQVSDNFSRTHCSGPPTATQSLIAGKEVIIGKAGKPVARIVRYNQNEEPRIPGAMQGKIHIAEDFDNLPTDIGAAFGMADK